MQVFFHIIYCCENTVTTTKSISTATKNNSNRRGTAELATTAPCTFLESMETNHSQMIFCTLQFEKQKQVEPPNKPFARLYSSTVILPPH